jgi:type IV secretion system protein TrbD
MDGQIPGFVTPVHRALTEPILMGGAPRSIAIVNGTLAAALGIGLRLRIAGLLLWFLGHMAGLGGQARS